MRRWVHVVVLVVLTSVVFSNTLENDYVLDSVHRVKENTEINRFWPPTRFFTDIRTGSIVPQIAEYRPFMPLSHAINNEIARATGTSRLAGYHVGNIVIHIGSAILVYFLFGILISQWGLISGSASPSVHYSHPAFAAALLFAVHPISGSAVNYIAARDLLLMVFFLLASMLVYVNMRRKGDTVHGWAIALLLLSMAILSKQSAIIGFGWVFLYEWVLRKQKFTDWRLWGRTLLFAIPTAGYFLLRWLWITRQNPEDPLRVPANIEFPLTMAKAHVFYYLKNFVWPFEMRALARFELDGGALDPGALLGVLFIVATLAIAWRLRQSRPLISLAILAYWLLFALEASIFPFRYVVTDYRQYLPLAFLCLIVSLLCFSIRNRTAGLTLLAGMTVYFSVSSYLINRHWKNEETFWRQSVTHGAVALAHANYGHAMAGRNPELAEHHYLEALKQDPTHVYANINLGLLYINQGRRQEGLALLRETARRLPNWALAHYWLSRGLARTDQKAEALTELLLAADLDPRQLRYQYQAASTLQDSGRWADSITYLERVKAFDPDYEFTQFLLGFAHQKLNRNDIAIEEYRQFLKKQPRHVQTHFNLAYALMNENQCEAAVEHFNTVLVLQPQYNEAHLHLSNCYRLLEDEVRAAEHARLYEDGK